MSENESRLRIVSKTLTQWWQIAGISIVLFVVLEIMASLVFAIRSAYNGVPDKTADNRVTADTYIDRSWVSAYFEEFQRAAEIGNTTWASYVYWRSTPFSGEYLSVDKNGLRATWSASRNLTSDCKPIKIFMFGGSTMKGTGARDEFTIPSQVSKLLDSRETCSRIWNFGQSGYVNTQEVVALMLELQKGNIPDLTVFYDGVNDTFSAFQQGVAGLPQNERNRIEEFNLTNSRQISRLRKVALRESIRQLSLVKLADGLVNRFTGADERRRQAVNDERLENQMRLAGEVRDVYSQNMEIVHALARYFDFDVLFYWQPTLFQKISLTTYERTEYEKAGIELDAFVNQVYDSLLQDGVNSARYPSFRDLSHIFTNSAEPYFIDWNHLGERGNFQVAQQIAEDISSIVQARGANFEEPLASTNSDVRRD